MALTRLVMRLARNPDAGFPEGDSRQGYVVIAPLGPDGELLEDEWRRTKDRCTVVRFTPDNFREADGWISRRGDNWYFRYDEDDEGPDEPIYKLGEHRLRLGEYVTVYEADGDNLTYKITETQRLEAGR